MPVRKIIAVFSLILLFFTLAPGAMALEMSDISGHWCEERIAAWVALGIMEGYPDGTFKPEGQVTRAEFVKITNRAFGFTGTTSNIFIDVASSDWFYDDVLIARRYGYIEGYSDGTFRPQNNITRQEAAKIIASIMGLPLNTSPSGSISDWNSGIDPWARGYVGAVYSSKVMGTYSTGEFKGKQALTRAECVYYLWEAAAVLGVSPKSADKTIRETAYNPETLEVVNNLTIDYSGEVEISNLSIQGNVYITSKTGSRTVTLKDCTVAGTIFFDYGNLILDGVTSGSIDASDIEAGRTVTILGESVFEQMQTNRGIVIDQSGLTGESKGIKKLNVGSDSTAQTVLMGVFPSVMVNRASQTVLLASGTIKELESEQTGTTVTLGQNTTLEYVYLSGQGSKVWGPGTVGHAYIDRSGLSFQRAPAKLSGPSTPSYSGDYKLTFTVKDSAAGKTLSGAEIKLDSYMASGKTAGSGILELTHIPDKTISYTVSMPGYEDVSGTVTMNGAGRFVDVSLKPVGEFTATLTVTDAVTGNPISGIYGVLTSASNQASSVSDSGGRLTFNKLASTAYTYSISIPGYATETGTFTISKADLVVAAPVKMQKTKVSLSAYEAANQTTAITAFEYSIPGVTSGYVRADTGGKAVIEGLKAGTSYTASLRAVNADGSVNTAYSLSHVQFTPTDSKTALDVKGYIMSSETFTYSVTVLSWDGLSVVNGATVTLQNGTWSGSAVSVNGIAQITGVPRSSSYNMTVTKSGYRTHTASAVAVDSTHTSSTVSLIGVRTVTVSVSLPSDAAPGMTVTLESVADGTRHTVTVDASGDALFSDIPDGGYKITSRHADYMIPRGVVLAIGPTVDFAFPAVDLDLAFTLLMMVSDGTPLPNGTNVTLTDISNPSNTQTNPVLAGGVTAEFLLEKGEYAVTVTGYACAPLIISLTMTAEGAQMSVHLTPISP